MHITVMINLAADQTISDTSTELADKILKVCKGDEEIDYCTVTVISSPVPGSAGTPPPSPEPFLEQQMPPPGQ